MGGVPVRKSGGGQHLRGGAAGEALVPSEAVDKRQGVDALDTEPAHGQEHPHLVETAVGVAASARQLEFDGRLVENAQRRGVQPVPEGARPFILLDQFAHPG